MRWLGFYLVGIPFTTALLLGTIHLELDKDNFGGWKGVKSTTTLKTYSDAHATFESPPSLTEKQTGGFAGWCDDAT